MMAIADLLLEVQNKVDRFDRQIADLQAQLAVAQSQREDAANDLDMLQATEAAIKSQA